MAADPRLHVVVAGGGIGGMATAAALHRRGIAVDVYEQAPALGDVGAGVGCHPNAVRALRRLGLGEGLERLGSRWRSVAYLRPGGELIAPWWPAGTDVQVYGMHRADLLSILQAGVPPGRLHLGRRCVGVEQDRDRARVELSDGEIVEADVVIAADGVHSALQRHVTPPVPAVHTGQVAYHGTLPRTSVGWPSGQMRSWLGPGKHFMLFNVRGDELVAYLAYVAGRDQARESWSGGDDPRRLRAEFAGWDEQIQRVLAEVTSTIWFGLYDRGPLATWTNGRLALLGDAAHPMLPHVGQGATQAMEDALTIASVLSRSDAASAPAALRRYEALRRERTTQVQAAARAAGARYDETAADLTRRDRELSHQSRDRSWMWDHDAEAEAEASLDAQAA